MGCHASNFRYEKLDEKVDESKRFLSRITIGFLSDIIQTGNERPLEEADLSSQDIECTRTLTEKLEDEWRSVMKIKAKRCSQPRLWNALCKAIDRNYICMFFLLIILRSFCILSQPVALSFLLEEMMAGSSSNVSILCLYSALVSASTFLQAFVHHNVAYSAYTMSVHVKASLIGLVYKKVGQKSTNLVG